jgi:hypothetical protein
MALGQISPPNSIARQTVVIIIIIFIFLGPFHSRIFCREGLSLSAKQRSAPVRSELEADLLASSAHSYDLLIYSAARNGGWITTSVTPCSGL